MSISRPVSLIAVLATLLFLALPLAPPPASAAGNRPPEILSPPPDLARAGYDYLYQVSATDPDGDRLNYSLGQFPEGMTIDFATGSIRWIPRANQTGNHSVTVTVSDGKSTVDQRFCVTVLAGPPPPPSIRITYPKDGQSVNRSVYLMGVVEAAPAAPAVRTVEVRVGQRGWELAVLSGEAWTYLLDTSKFPNRVYYVSVRASDGLKTAETNLNLTFDNPRYVLGNYPVRTDPDPLPFISFLILILVAEPIIIVLRERKRARRAAP